MERGTQGLVWMLGILVILGALASFALYRANTTPISASGYVAHLDHTQNIQVAFECGAHGTMEAIFMTATTSTTTHNSVQIFLPDGRQLTLPQTISADGGRYANKNESFVFWTKGDSAFVQERGTTTYDCVVKTK